MKLQYASLKYLEIAFLLKMRTNYIRCNKKFLPCFINTYLALNFSFRLTISAVVWYLLGTKGSICKTFVIVDEKEL